MKAMISIDAKKNRIRIHKQTLLLMSNPQFIHFIVNPLQGNIILISSKEAAKDALKISYGTGTDCELYSKSLIDSLTSLKPNAFARKTYRLSGEAYPSRNLAIFRLDAFESCDTLSKQSGGASA